MALLDVEILLTTMTKRSFRAEMDLVSKSNNFAGPLGDEGARVHGRWLAVGERGDRVSVLMQDWHVRW